MEHFRIPTRLTGFTTRLVANHPRVSFTTSTSTVAPPKTPHGKLHINLIVPPSNTVEQYVSSPKDLQELIRSYQGKLILRRDGRVQIVGSSEFKTLSPTEVYEIVSPFYQARAEMREHTQIADRAFEDKSRLTLIGWMKEKGLEFKELPRVIEVEKKIVAEWEAVFEVAGEERVFFLECKHCITTVSYLPYTVLTSI
jgi:hypothetical protein